MNKPAKVLIVEDDNALAQMCAKLLRRKSYAVVIAGSSTDAIAIVRTARDVDVVVSDVNMPTMSGIDLVSRMHEIDSDMPVILMSGRDTGLTAPDATALGASDYLVKPFDPQSLVDSVRRALERAPSRFEALP